MILPLLPPSTQFNAQHLKNVQRLSQPFLHKRTSDYSRSVSTRVETPENTWKISITARINRLVAFSSKQKSFWRIYTTQTVRLFLSPYDNTFCGLHFFPKQQTTRKQLMYQNPQLDKKYHVTFLDTNSVTFIFISPYRPNTLSATGSLITIPTIIIICCPRKRTELAEKNFQIKA